MLAGRTRRAPGRARRQARSPSYRVGRPRTTGASRTARWARTTASPSGSNTWPADVGRVRGSTNGDSRLLQQMADHLGRRGAEHAHRFVLRCDGSERDIETLTAG